MPLDVRSPAFEDGDEIPVRYTCDGENISPAIDWSGVSQETQSLALLMEDPDAPSGTFTHWTIYNIPRGIDGLPEDVPRDERLPDESRQCTNSSGKTGYTGPCPPPGGGSHRYYFNVYALDAEILLSNGATREEFLGAIKDHVIDEGKLMGRYQRRQARATNT